MNTVPETLSRTMDDGWMMGRLLIQIPWLAKLTVKPSRKAFSPELLQKKQINSLTFTTSFDFSHVCISHRRIRLVR